MSAFIRSVIILGTLSFPALAQQSDTTKAVPTDWFLEDPEENHVEGVSVDKAYNTLLKGQPSKTVIVAIVDTGVDTDHEDLKSVIWTNAKEIQGNGIDDDHNGYIDDVHGWNFLGGKEGDVVNDTYELTREYMRLKKKFEPTPESKIPKKQKDEYEKFQKIKTKYEKLKAKNTEEYTMSTQVYNNLAFCSDTLKKIMKVDDITPDNLDKFVPSTTLLGAVKDALANIFKNIGQETSMNHVLKELKDEIEYYGVIVNFGYNEEYDSRKIIGDNYSDTNQKNYGNNDTKGPDPLHGTHVAGIIGADRTNNTGIKGIADNVKLMIIRAVPNGDERDKDIANAIRYAVDNGANIVNMSFGKGFSPEKEAVDKAVKYAEQKGVLLVHASGNDSDDNDTEPNFPDRFYRNGKAASNWIEVGASGTGQDEHLIADFSNYGKKTVDLFAPGVGIYSTVPGNKYQMEDGTSMACPVVVGVAAVIMSYFPELSMTEVRDIMLKSTRKFDNLKVIQPRKKTLVAFSDLSITGGLVNAYDAVTMAQKIRASKKAK